MQSWLRGHGRLSAGRGAPAGAQRPGAGAAAGGGRGVRRRAVTAEQVAVIAPVAGADEHWPRPPGRASTSPRSTRSLAEVAATRPHGELAQVVHHYLDRLDPDGPEPDPTEGRSLSIAKHADGSVTGRVRPRRGRRGEGAGRAGVDRAGQPARRATPAPAPSSSADALVQLADNALAAGQPADPAHGQAARRGHHRPRRPGRPRTPAPAPAATGFGAPISAARARWLACDGNITRIVIGPDGPAAGPRPQPTGSFPPHLRTGARGPRPGLRVRRLRRPHPLVRRPPRSANGLDDGPTSVENSALLCERHHTKVHHGFRVERQPDGRWRTYRPDGTEILLHPDLLTA